MVIIGIQVPRYSKAGSTLTLPAAAAIPAVAWPGAGALALDPAVKKT